MNSDSSFTAIAVWAPRDQSQPDVAERWLRMIERLQPLHPVFTQWYVPNEDDDFVPLELDLTSVTDAVAAGVGRQDGI